MKHTWRMSAQSVIAKTISENQSSTGKELRAILRDAYPFGKRAMHPYKVWCEEVNRAVARVEGKTKAFEYIDKPQEVLTLEMGT